MMWARMMQAILGVWIIISLFVFPIRVLSSLAWVTHLAAGLALISVSLLSIRRRYEKVVVLSLLPIAWMLGYAYFGFDHPRPGFAQNLIITALLQLMLTIVPSRANEPPPARNSGQASIATVTPLNRGR